MISPTLCIFYSEQAGSVVSGYFLEEFERVATLLVEHPDLGTPTTKGRRTFPLKVFPYLIVYRNLQSNIRILIVRHITENPIMRVAGNSCFGLPAPFLTQPSSPGKVIP